jgi:adenosylhomocysteinase
MDITDNYHVKDISLAEQGAKNIAWAEQEMKALLKVKERFAQEKPLAGLKVGIALHPTKETAVLVRTLIAGGADVAICACNPLSTQDDVAAALAKEGVKIYAWKGQNNDEYYENLNKIVQWKPDITIDDGCDLVTLIHQKYPELISSLVGGCEETTTGIIRLKAMEKDGALKYPVIAVNDLKTKHLFDNFYGTGQSALDGVIRATNVLLAGKTAVVCGYGPCGRGVANRACGLGANVIVCEVDAFRALQATMDGYRVMPLIDAALLGDVFVTVTGDKHVVRVEHMKKMKDGAILSNAGHFDLELDITGLEKEAVETEQVRENMKRYTLDGKKLYVLADGRLVNLAAAEGHPSLVMAMSFCGQALCTEFLAKNKGQLKPGVVQPPKSMDNYIAALQLDAMGITIDKLTDEQKKYLSSWQEGT